MIAAMVMLATFATTKAEEAARLSVTVPVPRALALMRPLTELMRDFRSEH
jgi:hypothetical protein